jgi:S1-C subfamily serine protease
LIFEIAGNIPAGRYMKKLLIFVLCLALFASCGIGALADGGRFDIFLDANEWEDGRFGDVSSSDWFYGSLVSACKMGLIRGRSETSFVPDGNVTIAETITMASTLRRLYNTADTAFESSEPWYRCYVDYALENRIITGEYPDYGASATRAEFAEIMAHALPVTQLGQINTVQNGAIPDVSYASSYAGAVYELYRAGILTGSGTDGSFNPQSRVSRAEAVAILARLALPEQRRSITLTGPEKKVLTSEEVFAQCTPAVFFIQMYDADGVQTSSGSGFFISPDGIAVTCLHVLNGGVRAKITLSGSGDSYEVTGAYDYSTTQDWAVIKVDGNGTDFPYLALGDSSTNVGGTAVYAIGSPLGIQNTISSGLVCNPTRIEDGTEHILFSAAISSGSSGGPLINKYGEVIGINAATYIHGQNLNLAVKASYLDHAILRSLISLDKVPMLNVPQNAFPVIPGISGAA